VDSICPEQMASGPARKHASKSCKGCRLSKVRCDLETRGEHQNCSRCERLNLVCIPNEPSRRGRHGNTLTTRRLSPAVRALAKTDGCKTDAASRSRPGKAVVPCVITREAVLNVAPVRGVSDPTTLATGSSWPLHREEMLRCEHPGAHVVKLLWVKSAFSAAKRHQSWVLTNDALRMANELQLSLDDAMRMMSLGSEVVDPSAPPPSSSALPEFVAEWHHQPLPCVTRAEVGGCVRYLPNPALISGWEKLGVRPDELDSASSGTFDIGGVCDDYWLHSLDEDSDRRRLVRLFVETCARARDPGQMCFLEGEAPHPVAMRIGGQRIGPCRLRVRIALRSGGRETFECYQIVHASRALSLDRDSDTPAVPAEPGGERLEHANAGRASADDSSSMPGSGSGSAVRSGSRTSTDVVPGHPRGSGGSSPEASTPLVCHAEEGLAVADATRAPTGDDNFALPHVDLAGVGDTIEAALMSGATFGDGALPASSVPCTTDELALLTDAIPLEQLLQLCGGEP